MRLLKKWGMWISGGCAGAVNGLFGAGGGMVLVPLLSALTDLKEEQVFPASISIILPICLVSLTVTAFTLGLDLTGALPYLLGGAFGGLIAGRWGAKIPVKWLHRFLGALIIWGGLRYLW